MQLEPLESPDNTWKEKPPEFPLFFIPVWLFLCSCKRREDACSLSEGDTHDALFYAYSLQN